MIKFSCFFAFLFCLPTLLFSQNNTPEVTNVTFEQRTDGSFKVDIYYDLYDADGDEMTVSMEVSDDAGQTYGFFATLLTGDIGSGITSGTDKHIVWDFGAEHPDYFSDQIKIKIIADDGQGGSGMGEPCPGIPTVTYAGKTYNTVQIGNQCWLKENLNYETTNSWCYDNNSDNCATYGRLYTWSAAMNGSTTPGAQGICPNGWHIPKLAEFEELDNYVDDKSAALIDESETLSYTPTVTQNETGFSALFAGYRNYYGNFFNLGYNTYFWSSNEINSNYASIMYLYYNSSNVNLSSSSKENGFSVRCVQD